MIMCNILNIHSDLSVMSLYVANHVLASNASALTGVFCQAFQEG
jgi:hypothetical protein